MIQKSPAALAGRGESQDPTFHCAERFAELTRDWKEKKRFLSSVSQIAMLPSYQRIIGMGPLALPFIFLELEQEPDHWFWALASITGEDPVPPEHRGKIGLMAQAWLGWGRSERQMDKQAWRRRRY